MSPTLQLPDSPSSDALSFDALLFDLDGVLIHSERVWHQVMNAAARHFSHPEIGDQAFAEAWGQGVSADRDRFFPDRSLEEIAAFYDAAFPDHLEQLRVDPAVPEVFAAVGRRGIPSAVVTNTPNPLASDLVRRAGATPDHVLGGNDAPNAKPAPDLVLLACRQIGVAPARSLLVGDSRFDRESALAAGAGFLGVGIDGGVGRIESLGGLLALLD